MDRPGWPWRDLSGDVSPPTGAGGGPNPLTS